MLGLTENEILVLQWLKKKDMFKARKQGYTQYEIEESVGLCLEAEEHWQAAYDEFQAAANIQTLHRDLFKHLWFLAWKLGHKNEASEYMRRYSQL